VVWSITLTNEAILNNDSLPLAGIRVLEFTHAVMGPAAGLVLADMGAEVIRVEPAPHGDPTRRLEGFGTGYYTFFNRNKKSISVNVKTDAGREVVEKLIVTADILIENFGPGTMDRLGLGYDAASRLNPLLVYCSLKGFLSGPYEKRPALDEVVQMMSGLAYMTGTPGQPLRAGASVVDIMGGTFGALAALVALRERDITGEGQFVKNGLFETAVFIMGQHMSYAAISQELVPPMPARVSAWAVYRIFDTSDGESVFIGITSDRHWKLFCDVFGRADLFADESLRTNRDRINERERLLPKLEHFFAQMTKAEIIAKCDEAGIPFSPIARTEDLFDDPQLNAGRGMLPVTLPDGRVTHLPRLPIEIGDYSFDLRADAPEVGEHSRALLDELGYDADQIENMIESEAVAAQSPR
jgi:crotonobetainyl-CoA:carnitine CoA-transferase CaiB-like acyl-CoA transferase